MTLTELPEVVPSEETHDSTAKAQKLKDGKIKEKKSSGGSSGWSKEEDEELTTNFNE